jgi:hypothetical protein
MSVDVKRLWGWKGETETGLGNKSEKAAVQSMGNCRPHTEDEETGTSLKRLRNFMRVSLSLSLSLSLSSIEKCVGQKL